MKITGRKPSLQLQIAVIDGSIPHPKLSVLKKRIALTIRGGKIVAIDGGECAGILERILREFNDEWVYHVAEIGIGFNNMSTLSNYMLEDEGVMGTAHFGFGSNIGFGGTIESSNHLDMVFRFPTIAVDGRVIMRDGNPSID